MVGGLGWQPSEFWDAPIYDVITIVLFAEEKAAEQNSDDTKPRISDKQALESLERLNNAPKTL